MALKFHGGMVDILYMEKEVLTRRTVMLQWIGVLVAVLGLAYNGLKDFQKGEIKLPVLEEKEPELTKPVYPIQYCLMAYDPNLNKVFYQHENGQWYDYPPQQRRYSSPQEHHQTQGQKALASVYGTQGVSGNHIR
jgi:hypothetical protein